MEGTEESPEGNKLKPSNFTKRNSFKSFRKVRFKEEAEDERAIAPRDGDPTKPKGGLMRKLSSFMSFKDARSEIHSEEEDESETPTSVEREREREREREQEKRLGKRPQLEETDIENVPTDVEREQPKRKFPRLPSLKSFKFVDSDIEEDAQAVHENDSPIPGKKQRFVKLKSYKTFKRSSYEPDPEALRVEDEERKKRRHAQAEEEIGPPETETPVLAWCFAIVCMVMAVLVIMGGLAVLIGYLAFSPHIPTFTVDNGALQSLELDQNLVMSSSVLLLLTSHNRNSKVTENFRKARFQLMFEKHVIASQFVPPFEQIAGNRSVRHLVSLDTYQEQLSTKEGLDLSSGFQGGIVSFELESKARIRSKFGSITSITYSLRTHCMLSFSPPPPIGNGSLVFHHCRSKK